MKQIRRRILFLLKVVLSIFLLYLVIIKSGITSIADSLTTIGPNFYLALACALLFTFLKVFKWHRLVLAAAGDGLTQMDAAKSYLVGMAGGLLTPGRVGEVARAAYLNRQRKGLIVYLVAVDRIFEIAAVVLLALPGFLFYADIAAMGLAVLVLAFLMAFVYYPEFPLRWLQRLLPGAGKFAAIQKQIAIIVIQLKTIEPGVKFTQMGLALLSYGAAILQFHFLLNNYHHSPLTTSMLTQPLIMLTNVLPLTIGGLGVREGAAMMLLSQFKVPRAASISSAFMLFLLNTALPALAGTMVFILAKKRKGKT